MSIKKIYFKPNLSEFKKNELKAKIITSINNTFRQLLISGPYVRNHYYIRCLYQWLDFYEELTGDKFDLNNLKKELNRFRGD